GKRASVVNINACRIAPAFTSLILTSFHSCRPSSSFLSRPGGSAEISRWRKPPDLHQQYQRRAPAGAEQNIARSSAAPPGFICPLIPNRWLAPPANFHQPLRASCENRSPTRSTVSSFSVVRVFRGPPFLFIDSATAKHLLRVWQQAES